MKKLFYILLFTQITVFIYSQDSLHWQRIYQPPCGYYMDYPVTLCPSDNGNFFLFSTVLTKIDPFGNPIFSKCDSIGFVSAIPTNDGGCTMDGEYLDSGYLYRLNLFGNIIWRINISSNNL